MRIKLTRREFIKLSALSLGSLAFRRGHFRDWLPEEDRVQLTPLKTVRVGIRQDEIRTEPSLEASIRDIRTRDELIRVYEEFVSPHGPAHNPRWYRVVGGFMHTAHLPPVETHLNTPLDKIAEEGQVFKVTVPFTRSFRYTSHYGWEPLYRLYYQSNHWVTGIDEGPEGEPWYTITDDLLKIDYRVPAAHLRPIPPEDFEPISPEIENKRIKVSLKDQTVTCYENGEVVKLVSVSTGIPNLVPTSNGIPTETPRGRFNISIKTPVRHMGDGNLTDDIHAYELPGVPWSTFFTETGVAFHGTYWHDNYGGRMSHGCVNMRNKDAHWLYRWTTPVDPHELGKWHVIGYGTMIDVM